MGNQEPDQKRKFGNIFSSLMNQLDGFVYSEEYLASLREKEQKQNDQQNPKPPEEKVQNKSEQNGQISNQVPPVQISVSENSSSFTADVFSPTNIAKLTGTKPSESDVKLMLEKLYQKMMAINRPGIDFFEFWNLLEKFGGLSEGNMRNAFIAVNALATESISKEMLIESAQGYLKEISDLLRDSIEANKTKRKEIIGQNENSRQQLVDEIEDLSTQITQLQAMRGKKQAELNKLNSGVMPEVSEIEKQILIRESARSIFIEKLTKVVDQLKIINLN